MRKDRGIPSRDTNKYWDPSAVYDPGNYCYAVVMRAWASTSSGWLQDCVQDEWNDETLSDRHPAHCGHGHLGRLEDTEPIPVLDISGIKEISCTESTCIVSMYRSDTISLLQASAAVTVCHCCFTSDCVS